MNKNVLTLCVSVALCSTMLVSADSCPPVDAPTIKCYSRRSDGRHKYMQTVASSDKTHIGDADAMYGRFQANVGYRASFRSKDIAECFFGGHLTQDDCCGDRAIKIQGSDLVTRDPKAWFADYFYLPRNYDGSFSVDPKIKTFFADFDFYVGLEEWLCGFYFRLHGPVVHSRWDLNFCDNANLSGNVAANHPHGYFSPGRYEGDLLVQSFADYAKGGTPKKSEAIDPMTTGQPGNNVGILNSTLVFHPLKYAKITKCSRKETGFADLRAELGWNFWQSDCYHLGLNLQFAAPTGKKKEPCFLFDAMIGNGNHWEVGGGLTAHYNFWTSEDNENTFSFHLDANITHMFKECRKRTFDLCNKPNSAYMLAAKFGDNPNTDPPNDQVASDPTNDLDIDGTSTIPTRQFAGEYAPVANLSTVNVDVSIGVQADIVAQFTYTCGGMIWDFGYNFWGRSCEKIECPKSCKDGSICSPSQQNTWALKGDARMFGYDQDNNGTIPNNNVAAIPLSATQSGATILMGLNKIPPTEVASKDNAITVDVNPNVDSPEFAFRVDGNLDPNNRLYNVPDGDDILEADKQIKTSKTPVFLKCSDLDLTRTRGISHTVFANLSYTWDRDCWVPYLGVGFSAEFASNNRSCDNDTSKTSTNNVACCPPCIDCAVSQWGVWVMGGVAFN